MHPQLTGYRYSIAYPSSARHGPGQARLNGQGFFESSGVINDHLLCESADADIHTEVLQKAVCMYSKISRGEQNRCLMSIRMTKLKLLDLPVKVLTEIGVSTLGSFKVATYWLLIMLLILPLI
jgi:hypothetical protein